MPGAFAASGSMASRPRTPRSNPLKLSTVPLDRLVQFLVVAVLDQVGQDLKDPARAAVESQLSARQITFTQASLDGRSFIDCPEAPQRKGGHKPNVSLSVRDPGAHPVVRLGSHWIYLARGRWLGFAHGENDGPMAMPHLRI
jgi:hypothetical protein